MPMFNVVNPEAIEQFLCDIAEEDVRLFVLLRECLTRPLLREEAGLDRVTRRPARPPHWLSEERFATEGPFYRFSATKLAADPRLSEAVLAVKRWLQEALDEPQGRAVRPRMERLKNVGRLEHVLALIEKDRRQALARGVAPMTPETPAPGDTEIALRLPRGWQWRRLLTPEALRHEGMMMRHCLGNGHYDVNVLLGMYHYYSLRDAWGRARVTLEVREGVVTQRRGRANSMPAPRYHDAIKAFLEAKGWTGITPFRERWGPLRDFSPDPYYTGAVEFIDGDLDWRFLARSTRVPYVLRLTGTLDLRGWSGLTVLPRALSVGGDLLLEGAVNLERMPDWLWVAGDLNMKGCHSVKALGAYTAVRGHMWLNDCTSLLRLPMEMRVGKTLDLSGCTHVNRVPERVLVLGATRIEGSLCPSVEAANRLLDPRYGDSS